MTGSDRERNSGAGASHHSITRTRSPLQSACARTHTSGLTVVTNTESPPMSTREYVEVMAENSVYVEEESREGPSQRMSFAQCP